MNYHKSKEILEEVKKTNKILINCHKSPDPDSIASALALCCLLERMGKKVTIICPSKLDARVDFLPGYPNIKIIDFSKFEFLAYDLFFCLDSSSWDMVSNNKNLPIPEIKIIVIDHHITNTNYGKINLLDSKANSTGQIIFKILEDWEIKIDKNISQLLLTAILADTVDLKYGVTPETLDIVKELIIGGADKKEITYHIFDSLEYRLVKFWGEVIKEMTLDTEAKFVWAAIPFEKFKEYGSPDNGKESAATEFFESIKGTDFGVLMVEKDKGSLNLSFRSRSRFDVSKLALEFGGGGHHDAAGGAVRMPFEKARDKVLETIRKFVKKYEHEN